MKFSYLIASLLVFGMSTLSNAQNTDGVKTTFQTSREWRPTIDNRTEAVMVYGVGGNPSDRSEKPSFEERVKSWKERGYTVHFMTGIAWGEYQDYFTGKWDGKWHLDEGQVTQKGDTIWHGYMVPYIVPSDNFLNYLKERHIKRVIDAGVKGIFMEEPEFWARAGYSESFKKEWKKYYGFPWQPQDKSPENTYLSNKLKYHLYYNALKEVFTFAKEYGKTRGLDVKCYVPTHSLVNYSQWMIVSPEASLASLPCVDGYIAQVWTGTSREPNYYNGKAQERVFETAYLEYGSMESMTAPTKRKVFFLTDPIEDRSRDWSDYKKNYQATFVAQLLYPNIANYEVMPWPERIYEGLYRTSANSNKKQRIPRFYSTQIQVMINALNKMPLSRNKVTGSRGISVLMSNSLMFQRFPSHKGYNDPQLSNFYGLALPLLKRGVPVKTVHMENLKYKESLADTKVLLMSYSNMKPLEPKAHQYIAEWVKKGGVLIFSGTDKDPFQTVREWWNTQGNKYETPSAHLFEQMRLPKSPQEGEYQYGKGTVYIVHTDPKAYVLKEGGDHNFIELVSRMYERKAKAGKLTLKNNFYLQRGAYDLIAVMKESVSETQYKVKGCLIDLFDPKLPVYDSIQINPGEQALLLNVERIKNKKKAQVLASASKEYNEQRGENYYKYVAKSPAETTNISRVLLPVCPRSVKINGKETFRPQNWNAQSRTYLIEFENSPQGVSIQFHW